MMCSPICSRVGSSFDSVRSLNDIHYLVKNGFVEGIDLALKNNISLLEKKVMLGFTPLHSASTYGNVDAVELLIDRGANLRSRTYDGRTALHCAAENGHTEAVEILITYGCEVNASTRLTVPGLYRTAIHLAAQNGHERVIELLCQHGAVIDAKDKNGDTPLILAAKENKIEAVEMLLILGADINIQNKNEESALSLMPSISTINLQYPHRRKFLMFQSGCAPLKSDGEHNMCQYLSEDFFTREILSFLCNSV